MPLGLPPTPAPIAARCRYAPRPCVLMNSSADSGSVWMPSAPAPRAELLHVLMLPDFERADRIGEFWSYPESRTLRRAADRLRGGSDPSSGARRDAPGRSLAPLP
jgi:hypothetical protein